MGNKYLLISLEDERAKKLADVLGNKTCKKIIDYLAETKESSEKDIAQALHLPLNTVEYNLKKLIQSEMVEKTKNFFWSVKGKKIPMYKLSNKSIVISPKSSISSKVKHILPVALLSGLAAVAVRQYTIWKNQSQILVEKTEDVVLSAVGSGGEQVFAANAADMAREAPNMVVDKSSFIFAQPSPVWVWFLAGALLAILIFAIINWRRI